MKYLTIGSCLKNEESYMLDFVEYHRHVGVEHFVFLDREYYPLNSILGNEPDVEIIHFPDVPENTHQDAWGKLIEHNQGKTKWLALIDADQALVPQQVNDVRLVLKDYEEFASLQCNWHTFGSSNHLTREPGAVYERFILRANDDNLYNVHTQFICQPDRTLPIKTLEPHYPLLPEGEVSVNTNKQVITADKVVELNPNTPLSFNVPPLHDKLWVAHYTNKSKEEWLIKNSKGRADIYGAKMPMEQFDQYESVSNLIPEFRVFELWSQAKTK